MFIIWENLMIKKFLIIILAIFLGVIIFLKYDSDVSPTAMLGEKNKSNFKRVSIGMDSVEVVKIMGLPEDRWEFRTEITYSYSLPPGESGSCTFTFNSTGIVIHKRFIEDD